MSGDTRQKRDPDQVPSLFSALMANLGRGRSAEARRFNLEILLGILGFFTLMALIQLVVAELRGTFDVGYSLLVVALGGATWLVYRRWRKAGGRSTPDTRR